MMHVSPDYLTFVLFFLGASLATEAIILRGRQGAVSYRDCLHLRQCIAFSQRQNMTQILEFLRPTEAFDGAVWAKPPNHATMP
jgi:hypothetical protein